MSLKSCVILYHKNISKIYKKKWIDRCISSIKNQTYKDYYVFDLNYGDDNYSLSKYFKHLGDKYRFINKKLENHAEAMNSLLDLCEECEFDCVFNVNLDDYYDETRFEKQISKIEEGYDLVSSNMQYIKSDQPAEKFYFSDWNSQITVRLNSDNIICHPSVCYSKKFLKNVRYNSDDIPQEDWSIWITISKEFINKDLILTDPIKFYICEDFLCYYRIHNSQITSKSRASEKKLESGIVEEFCECGGLIMESIKKYPDGKTNSQKNCIICNKKY